MLTIKNEKYFTPQEVAEKFDVHISTVARWRQTKQLLAYQINNRKFLFSESAIESFVKGEK